MEEQPADANPDTVAPDGVAPRGMTPGVAGSGLVGRFVAMVGRLRHPWIFAITGALFLVDLVIPDLIPFIDEMLLGLATVLLALWRKRKDDAGRAGAEQTPRDADATGAVAESDE